MAEDISIAFGYPYGNGFDPNFLQSIQGLIFHESQKPKEERVLGSFLSKGSCYVDGNRDGIAIDFVNITQDTHLVMCDTDIAFPPNLLEQFATLLRKFPEVKIVAARVNLANGFPVFYVKHPTYNMHYCYPFDGVKEFDFVGTGIICIAREVFDTLYQKQGHPHFFHKLILEGGVQLGDDLSFCHTAREVGGYKIYGAWDITGQHYRDSYPLPSRYVERDQLIVHKT